jgi:hypothetical protein
MILNLIFLVQSILLGAVILKLLFIFLTHVNHLYKHV